MSRRAARELALKALFQVDVGGIGSDRAVAFAISESQAAHADLGADAIDPEEVAEDSEYCGRLAEGVVSQLKELDSLLARYAVGWHLPRMGAVDRNIIRMATWEVAFAEPPVPVGVALNEAVELAKIYGDSESPKFVNGVLANVVKGLQLLGRL